MLFVSILRTFRLLKRPVFDLRCYSSCGNYVKEAYVQKYLENVRKNVENSPHGETNDIPNSKLSEIFKSRVDALENIESLKDLEKEDTENKEWKETIREERQCFEEKLHRIDFELISALVPKYPESNSVEFGISAGVGGQEAMLFAKDLFDMYLNYFNYKSWESFVAEFDLSDQGGLRHACVLIDGRDVMTYLRFECGVHRVQRVPSTEKSGRIHTSTVTVSVIPQAPEIVAEILPKDLIIETKRSSGAGGQHVNTTDSCVRMTHVPSGLVVECQTERSQIKNRQIALRRLRNMLYQKQLQEQEKNIRDSKKFQIGTSARSDKVRTYNYVQDRITDHRIHQTWHNLPQYLKGGESLDNTITRLIEFYEEENLQNFLLSLKSMGQ